MKYFGTISDPKDLVNKEYIDDGLEVKANIDGAYEDMTVGNAEQLVSTVFVNDQVPYTYRTSGGSADIGDREYDQLVGGTIAWNQLATTTSFSGVYGDGAATIALNNDGVAIAGHVYGIFISELIDCRLRYPDTSSWSVKSAFLFKAVNGGNIIVQARGTEGDAFSFHANAVDLTQLFGTTIADYIYTLEQNNAGDGVAWVTKLFPKLNGGYYPYNAGELLSVSGVSAHNMTGLNQFNAEIEQGTINGTTGQSTSSSNRCRSDYFPCVPGTVYSFNTTNANNASKVIYEAHFYDAGQNYLGFTSINAVVGSATTPATCHYMRILLRLTDNSNTTPADWANAVCVNISWDGEMDGIYEPYKLTSYPLDSSLTLRGIPKLDANNALYYDGDTYEADGTVTRRYGVVDLGTLGFDDANENGYTIAKNLTTISGAAKATGDNKIAVNLITSKYEAYSWTAPTGQTAPASMCAISGDGLWVNVKDAIFIGKTGAQIRAALSGIYMVYELATSTTETADPFQSPQIVNDFGTEEYVTTAQSGVLVPVGHNTNYANNLRAKLEMAPESPSGDGDYIVRQTSGQNSYVPLTFPVSDIPAFPTTDGTYSLQVVVSGGVATASWVSA